MILEYKGLLLHLFQFKPINNMAKKISLSQFKSKVRQIENKQRQAVNKYNQEVRRYNQKVKQSINKYNSEVRAHNTRVRANRQRLKSEINKLNRQNYSTKHTVYQTSVIKLSRSYERVDKLSEQGSLSEKYNHYLDLSEKEAANSAEVMNSLLSSNDVVSRPISINPELKNSLNNISSDLCDRWIGAVYALNPNNPDAARHFCTSSREIITQILEIKAPDSAVFNLIPSCTTTPQGKPTRRSKIKFFLAKKDIDDYSFESFVDEDINNILDLFQVFNDGTHGSAGKYNMEQLASIKKRVEDGIFFLAQIIN